MIGALTALFATAGLVMSPVSSAASGHPPGDGSGSGYCSAHGGYTLPQGSNATTAASFMNVYPCGPNGGYAAGDLFMTSWQCVEFAARYLFNRGFEIPHYDYGRNFATEANQYFPTLPLVAEGSGRLPSIGDIISMWGGASTEYAGHVAVVTNSPSFDANGNATISVVEENASAGGRNTISVTGFGSAMAYNGGQALFDYTQFNWLHVGSAVTPPPCKNSGISGSVLSAGQYLCPGEEITSSSGPAGPPNTYRLILQTDGNLVEYSQFKALWASNTAGQTVQDAVMQGDGNLVIYTPSGTPIWASGTSGHPGSHLVLQGDANAVIYTTSGSPVWADGIVASFTQQLIVNTHNAYSVRICGINQYGSLVCNTWNTPDYTTDLSNWWWLDTVAIYAYSGYNGQGALLDAFDDGPVGEAPGYWFSVTFP